MKNILIGVLVLGVVVAIAGAYEYPKLPVSFGVSPTGSTFTNAKFAGVTANLAAPGANGTSSSVLNTDANDRFVTGVRAGCEGIGTSKTAYTGAGLAALTFNVATSSAAAPASLSPTNYVAQNLTIATATIATTLASSTSATNQTGLAGVWHPGEYMTFFTNATNTATCTFGVDYIGS